MYVCNTQCVMAWRGFTERYTIYGLIGPPNPLPPSGDLFSSNSFVCRARHCVRFDFFLSNTRRTQILRISLDVCALCNWAPFCNAHLHTFVLFFSSPGSLYLFVKHICVCVCACASSRFLIAFRLCLCIQAFSSTPSKNHPHNYILISVRM